MKRLGKYLAQLSELLGEGEYVHFSSVTKGSAMLNVDIHNSHYEKVVMHVREAPSRLGTKKRRIAYENLL